MNKCCEWWQDWVTYIIDFEEGNVQGDGLGIYKPIIMETITTYCPICGRKITKNEVV